MKNRLIVSILAIALLGTIAACGGSKSQNSNASTSSTATEATTEEVTTEEVTTELKEESEDIRFKENVYEDERVRFEITDYKVIPIGEKGNEYGEKPVIAFWYNTTNISGENIDPMEWIMTFKAVQDNNPNAINELNVASLPDEQFLDSQTETIKKGGTVPNAVAYELDDEETPVDLIAESLLGDKYGTQRFEISQSSTAQKETKTLETLAETEEIETEPPTTETEEPETEPPMTETEKSETEAKSDGGLRPEFKEAMDSYEAFMDEYCEFMEKYNKSDDTISLLSEYGKYLEKYADFASKFEKWKDENLNDEELKYYNDVNLRVLQKLNNVM